jgi:uncharacterized protein YgbK (DUF1537 family)
MMSVEDPHVATRRLLVLDDDPTGSQSVSEVKVAFDLDPRILTDALDEPGSVCFALTNSRAVDECRAVDMNRGVLRGVLGESRALAGFHVVSRSDSTLRGHVVAEPRAICEELSARGISVDAILFCPAMLEAGRFTKEDIHFAVVDGAATPVAETDYARDATFGYTNSRLPQFLEERSGGTISAQSVRTISLEDIREGGVDRVVEILGAARDRCWVVVNATEYSDLYVVADAVRHLELTGRTFVSRCGPSFVRALSAQEEETVISARDIVVPSGRRTHGMVVVGSHVGLTTAQLQELRENREMFEVEIDVASLLDERRRSHLEGVIGQIGNGLTSNDCVVYTSRDLVSTANPDESLKIARTVSDAVVEIVRRVRTARPAWVVAKGGITSHEVAASGLGIRMAEVQGQFWPGQVSLFVARDAPEEVIGMPYVVFPGNVGQKKALAEVVERLTSAVANSGITSAIAEGRRPANIIRSSERNS